jgi:hypothetical protein
MYTVVVNTADDDTTGEGLRKNKRVRTNGSSETATAAAQSGSTGNAEPNRDDSADGFAPGWREESEARIARRREVIATAGNRPSSRNYGSVGDSGTNLVDEEEEER